MQPKNPQIPFNLNELYATGSPKIYTGQQLRKIAFPIGGIGTGCISLMGNGQISHFEIFNRPNKKDAFQYTFFTLYAEKEDGSSTTRTLQGPVFESDVEFNGSGPHRILGSGLPRFRALTFEGAFPFARLHFDNSNYPLNVTLEAFNPFIPLNPDDSGIPAALFNVILTNTTTETIKVKLYANLQNRIGEPEVGGALNEVYESDACRGVKMSTKKHAPDSARYGTMALVTPHKDVQIKTQWNRKGGFDELTAFWNEVSGDCFQEVLSSDIREKEGDIATIGLGATIKPGETIILPVWMIWHMPNFEHYWSSNKTTWKNYYATVWEDAVAVAEYIGKHYDRLYEETKLFADAIHSSTLPQCVTDAVTSQLSTLNTTTCFRLTDGTFYAWEGAGCCEGTCTHVWNYAQAMPYLFPTLERSIREKDYENNLHDNGHMTFRMPLPLGVKADQSFHAAGDGQLGGVMKVYRDWQICGDDEWLKNLWEPVKRSLEYAWLEWDKDKDGVTEGRMHNTYDIEFFGPNTMVGSFYLGALRAAEEIARYLGDTGKADEYRALFESGSQLTDEMLFNGEYYIQKVVKDDVEEDEAWGGIGMDPKHPEYPVYQYGMGCLSDQLIGQWYARMLRLGDLYEPENIVKALAAIFKYNWKNGLWDHANPQRVYAFNDEAGLLLTSWPRGHRPEYPFIYSDEVWPGVEYQVASHMIYEGLIDEGLAIVKGLRNRFDGTVRNPWNEFECGNHYARSMASYAVMLALCDFSYSAPNKAIGFAPKVYADDFKCFFSVASGWGMLKQSRSISNKSAVVEVFRGAVELKEVRIGLDIKNGMAFCGNKAIKAEFKPSDGQTLITLSDAVVVDFGNPLVILDA